MAQARFLRDGRAAALPLRVGALLTSDADLRSRLPPVRGCIAWCFPRVASQRQQTLPPRQRQRFLLLDETLPKSKQLRDDDDGDDGHDDGDEDDADGAADDDDGCDAGDGGADDDRRWRRR